MTSKERFIDLFLDLVIRPGAEDLLAWLGATDFLVDPARSRVVWSFA